MNLYTHLAQKNCTQYMNKLAVEKKEPEKNVELNASGKSTKQNLIYNGINNQPVSQSI